MSTVGAATATLTKTTSGGAALKAAADCVGNACISNYIVPGALTGIFLFIMIILVFMCGFYQLVAIQTPFVFAEKSPDWGKVEETEG